MIQGDRVRSATAYHTVRGGVRRFIYCGGIEKPEKPGGIIGEYG